MVGVTGPSELAIRGSRAERRVRVTGVALMTLSLPDAAVGIWIREGLVLSCVLVRMRLTESEPTQQTAITAKPEHTCGENEVEHSRSQGDVRTHHCRDRDAGGGDQQCDPSRQEDAHARRGY
jgi:hypothetical protein